MNTTLQEALRSWPFSPWLLATLVASGGVYWRGWRNLRRHDPGRWMRGKLTAFLGGLAAIYLALASPVETFSCFLLSVHMTQHMLLMMVAAPLVWLGAPMFPLLRGLPRPIRAVWLAPLVRSPVLRAGITRVTQPVLALTLFTAVTWLWHLPAAYELALRNPAWHDAEHFCFLGAALLFWYGVVRPYPARPDWSGWLLLPVLLAADVQNTLLSALFTFSKKILYPYYAELPRIAGVTALEDQSLAGVVMWIVGSVAFLAPLCWIGLRLLGGNRALAPQPPRIPQAAAPAGRRGPFDLLTLPVIGRFLKWRHARLALQVPCSILAIAIIADGLFGPRIGAMNLAGVLPWIHWRGLVVLGLLVAGNVFCMGCPFLLPRTIARWFLPAGRNWPRWLRNKWLALLLLGLFFWSYEAFSLWDSPRWTAWIALSYFALALVVDGFFRGASFCKYVCPIGQFNFVQSLVSPLEVKVREPHICASCRTKECIRGGEHSRGCELHLYQPRKQGNLDCTFCLDCVHACPHENVGILAVSPGRELGRDVFRSGIGRFGRRVDLAAVVLVLVFAAFANAAGMIAPVVASEERLRTWFGWRSTLPIVSLFYFAALVVLPFVAVGGAAMLSRWLAGGERWLPIAMRYTYALVPLGFGMWLAHYSFHLLSSYDTVIPTTQRVAADLGWTLMGEPRWSCSCCGAVADWLPRLEIVFLDFGLLLSLLVGYRIASARSRRPWQALRAWVPWAILMVALFCVGVWIVVEPMQMRGMISMGS
jgi:cytochrome c oxidase assembly factor CtaG/ferredoxin